MDVDTARRLLADGADTEESVFLPLSVLSKLSVDDLPPNTFIEIGILKDGVMHVEWEGRLYRQGDRIIGEADYTWTRKYWYAPVGLEQYPDLVRRAVELRNKTHHGVELTHYDDDGAYIQLTYAVSTEEKNLGRALDAVRRVCSEVEETAEQTADEIGKQIAAIAARLSGWGAESLNALLQTVDKAATTDEKGRSLEELCSRLFESVPGFSVNGRIRTATEEIDLSILNDSHDPRFRRESALLLAECKNWTGRCGKDEFVVFREKIKNRKRRCTLGFLISWNGFATTVTKEMLRGSREEILIVPVSGKELRAAVRYSTFLKVLVECWDKAVHL
jgi:Restriction endonuclease